MAEIVISTAEEARREMSALIDLLQDAVESGASVGFLAPLEESVAAAYWRGIIEEVERGIKVLFLARHEGRVVGTVQLVPAQKLNGLHRAEIHRLIVHRSARRRGIGRALMLAAEEEAARRGRWLLMLDTRRGDPPEEMYRRLGYLEVGVVPQYVRLSDGSLRDYVFFYKILTPERGER